MIHPVFSNNRTDPTQTTVIRSRFAGAAGGRFRALSKAARDFIAGHAPQLRLGAAFASDIFMPWLGLWIADKILDTDGSWMQPYAIAAYLSGIRYADRALIKAGMPLKMPESFNPVLVYGEEIKVIQGQNFRLLKGITEVMNLQIKEHLIRGVLDGLNPRDVAGLISDRVMKIGYTRAVVLARTETIRAHAEATLTRFETFGIDRVNGQAEWITARDSRVCSVCEDLDGKVFSLSEARGRLPRHPLCRCAWLPVTPARLLASTRRISNGHREYLRKSYGGFDPGVENDHGQNPGQELERK